MISTGACLVAVLGGVGGGIFPFGDGLLEGGILVRSRQAEAIGDGELGPLVAVESVSSSELTVSKGGGIEAAPVAEATGVVGVSVGFILTDRLFGEAGLLDICFASFLLCFRRTG